MKADIIKSIRKAMPPSRRVIVSKKDKVNTDIVQRKTKHKKRIEHE